MQSAYYSHHSTLIASHTLFLVARRSLFKICCSLIADRFALLSSCFSLFYASHSVLVTLILLLTDYYFLILLFLIKGPKLFTLMTLNVTPIFMSNWVGLNLWERNLRQIFSKIIPYSCTLLNNPQLIGALCSISFIAVLCSLIVFRVRSQNDTISQYFADISSKNHI